MMNRAEVNDELVTVLYTGDEEECVNLVKQAREDLDQRENKIDEEWNGHAIGDYATRKFDLCHPRVSHHGLTSPHCFPDGSSQAVVQDAWVTAGAEYDNSLLRTLLGLHDVGLERRHLRLGLGQGFLARLELRLQVRELLLVGISLLGQDLGLMKALVKFPTDLGELG